MVAGSDAAQVHLLRFRRERGPNDLRGDWDLDLRSAVQEHSQDRSMLAYAAEWQ